MWFIPAAAVAVVVVIGAFHFLPKIKENRPTVQQANQELRSTENKFINKRRRVTEEIAQAEQTITTNVLCDERAALVALKRKKHFENQLHKTDGLLLKIGSLRQDLENANDYKEVVEKVSYASEALGVFHQQFDIQGVHDLLADIQEQAESLNEIYWVITEEPADFRMDYNTEELMNQIEELKQEALDRQLLQIGGTASLPSLNEF
ncbi:charged multivesicular body protein 4c-like [Acropora millepora]|uniref:charged multivesicular body protein 4c-like n=1 Tax=Acropora millepora TaxID=45264 RepID=UPI001CF416B7|nr:charged multivesicular body protein 4c-like [Acropora millepora]